MVILIATMTWLVWSNSNGAEPVQVFEADEIPGGGTVVRSEVLHLWLPATLGDLASRPSQTEIGRDHQSVRRFLEDRHQENLKYALTVRGHQVNGGYADITFIRHPYENARSFQEFLDILAYIGGKQDGDAAGTYAEASVHIISEELLSREPSEMLVELQRAKEDHVKPVKP